MNIIACMGPMIGFGGNDVIIFLGIALAVEAFLASSIALLINQVFKIRMRTVLGVEAIALLVCGLISVLLEVEWMVMLALPGAFVCGCLFFLGWLFICSTLDKKRKVIFERKKVATGLASQPPLGSLFVCQYKLPRLT
ncbi:MAG: hypothetical protein ACREBD_33850, partial [Blastocatellia bacterium]